MAGGTITVTNVGSFGAEFGTPIINHPEAAILALGVHRAPGAGRRRRGRGPAGRDAVALVRPPGAGRRGGRAGARARWRTCCESPFRLGALPAVAPRVKIVSLLPSATEIVYALGLGDQLDGVTYECDYPAEATSKPVVSDTALPQDRPLVGRRDRRAWSASSWIGASPSTRWTGT